MVVLPRSVPLLLPRKVTLTAEKADFANIFDIDGRRR
jgi:hypothetical protein